jgi:hypothetical protein
VDWGRAQSELDAMNDAFKTFSSRIDPSLYVGRVLSSPYPDKELALVRTTPHGPLLAPLGFRWSGERGTPTGGRCGGKTASKSCDR